MAKGLKVIFYISIYILYFIYIIYIYYLYIYILYIYIYIYIYVNLVCFYFNVRVYEIDKKTFITKTVCKSCTG